eukprot:XP_008681435.1 uncharacterized protein LOC100273411 isoform X2 [Zea mays]
MGCSNETTNTRDLLIQNSRPQSRQGLTSEPTTECCADHRRPKHGRVPSEPSSKRRCKLELLVWTGLSQGHCLNRPITRPFRHSLAAAPSQPLARAQPAPCGSLSSCARQASSGSGQRQRLCSAAPVLMCAAQLLCPAADTSAALLCSTSSEGEIPAMLVVQLPPPEVAGEDESNSRGVFVEFMTKVAQFNELVESGERLLGRFREELEYFRRPQISKEADVMNQILKSNCTVRMRSYIETGCRVHCQNISNINQLSSCENGLKDHIKKVKTLLEELECLVENVYGITLTASLSALEVSDSQCLDSMLSTDRCSVEEDRSADRLDRDVSFATVMVMVRNALKADYTMQEKIVCALSLKTPSSELEGYCLMWNLRPYIDDDVMRLAWKMCP